MSAEAADDMAAQSAVRGHGKKLFGRAFYKSIGSPKYVLAPMVDQSEFAWRMLTRSFLPADSSKKLLAYSPMLHSRLFVERSKYRSHQLQPLRGPMPVPEKLNTKPTASEYRMDGNPALDRPLFIQFCANSPDELLEAAKFVEPFCDAVDLNLGCPQGIARKGHYGAFLQEDWDLIYRLINRLHTELSVPVTAKMRILDTKEETLEYAKMILSAGASIITVHGRRREQKGHNTGLADWTVLRYLRENLPPETVIFANGNILQHEDIAKCLEATGADGVMSAEANLTDPTIFAEPPSIYQEDREYWRGRDGKGGYRIDAVMRRYLDIIYNHVLERDPPRRWPLFTVSDLSREELENGTTAVDEDDNHDIEGPPRKKQKRSKKEKEEMSLSLCVTQKHLFGLLRPLVSKHTDIRDALARSQAGDMSALEGVLSMVEAAVKKGITDYENEVENHDQTDETVDENDTAGNEEDNEAVDPYVSSQAAIQRCKRPWWICQPYIRPMPQEAFEKGALTLSRKEKKKQQSQTEQKNGSIQENTQQSPTSHETQPVLSNTATTGNDPHHRPVDENQTDENNVPIPQAGLVCG